jgi:hypothetical protein
MKKQSQNKDFESVIASVAKQSRDGYERYGLLRRFAPRNDSKYDAIPGAPKAYPGDADDGIRLLSF